MESNAPVDQEIISKKRADIVEALKGAAPQDISIKCWECGERFIFTVGEQQFYKQKGFTHPKRCEECRDKDKFGDFYM